MTATQVAGDDARSLAHQQNIDTILTICTALDTTLGRDWRNRDADAGAAITRLAEEAERRGKVKALRAEADRLDRADGVVFGGVARSLRARAIRIESGEDAP